MHFNVIFDNKRQQTITVDYKRLINGLVGSVIVILSPEIIKSTFVKIPEFIEGIPTAKNASRQRREIIKQEYIRLLEHLQLSKGRKTIYNEYLQNEIFIIMRESEKKASNSAAFNWQSTYAVKHLESIIRYAVPLEGKPIYSLPKSSGKQKEFGYVNIATLYYHVSSKEYEYMNFDVKLVLGVKNDGRHIQYSINKVEVK